MHTQTHTHTQFLSCILTNYRSPVTLSLPVPVLPALDWQMIRADDWCTILTVGKYCSADRQDPLSCCHCFVYNCHIYCQGNEPRNWGFWFHNQCFAKCYLATLMRSVYDINYTCRAECGVLSAWEYPAKFWVFGENPLHFGITNLTQAAPTVCRATPPESANRLILDTAASEPRNSPSSRNKSAPKIDGTRGRRFLYSFLCFWLWCKFRATGGDRVTAAWKTSTRVQQPAI